MPDVVPIAEQRPEPLTLALWTAGVLNRWRTIMVCAVGTLVLAVLAALVLPPSYRVTVSFAPNPSSSSKLGGAISSLSTGALSGLTSGMGLGSVGGEPTESPEFYAELMETRELLTRLLLTRFPDPRTATSGDTARLVDIMKLRSTNPARRIELGVKQLEKSMTVESNVRTNLIKVTVDDRYPTIASREANTAIALVNSFNLEQRTSRARAKRVYLQSRTAEARSDLISAQARYRDFLSSNRQWRLSPTLSSDEETLRRNQDIASDLYLSLEKQVESAKLDEFNDAALITVVDSAVTPVKPYWPRYSLLIPGAILLGIFIGVTVAGVATVYADWSRREPTAARELASAIMRRKARTDVPPVARRA
ncbi:MAG: GNVR domain-containing protein [Gemmatimonadaceae bacterium]